MSEKILIASDSTCDLSPELIEQNNIKILPLGVSLGENNFIDGVDITPDDIYVHYEKTKQLPKTAAVNVAEFSAFFEKYVNEGYSIVMFTISAQMSSTYNNARLAAEEFEGVYAVNTENLSTGGGLLVLSACQMAKEGMSAKEIAEKCEQIAKRVDASFIIDSLEFLYKGGRCSALEALGANLLQLKPCITVRGGKMGVGKKYRGKFGDVLKKYISDQLGNGENLELDYVFVTHAGCEPQIVDACVEEVKSLVPFKNLFVTRAGCTISSHCGRNTLGVLFIRKTPLE
ncbi:MAG: DegV family protein [Clostridia bacterium]|nr:DegV family protein [Clostridia bacterium]